MKYCMLTPITLETIQYKGRPLGHCREKNPKNMGIIHSIMVWLDCWRGSGDGIIVIFCCTQVEAATSRGKTIGDGSGSPRLSQRNWSFRGAAECIGTKVIHEYSFWDNPTKSSGLVKRVWMRTRNRPIRMGNWTTSGPRQPTGLTPDSRYRRIVS